MRVRRAVRPCPTVPSPWGEHTRLRFPWLFVSGQARAGDRGADAAVPTSQSRSGHHAHKTVIAMAVWQSDEVNRTFAKSRLRATDPWRSLREQPLPERAASTGRIGGLANARTRSFGIDRGDQG